MNFDLITNLQIIPNCPFNLLGRELMYRLGCCLTFGEDGFTIETPINSLKLI